MKARVLPYKSGSASAKALAQSLNGLRVKHNGTFRHTRNHLVVNWGCADVNLVSSKCDGMLPSLNCSCGFDGQLNTAIAGNKLEAFNVWKNHIEGNIPEFTTDKTVAQSWLDDDKTVVVRTLLRGSGGRGIHICSKGDPLPQAPLYVQYVKKEEEYRVHVFCGGVIDVQRKMRKRDVPDEAVNWQVRNHSNGFVFGREGVNLPDSALSLCATAINLLHLDFGAVDIIHNAKSDTYYVLEVNTAPGLEGTTLEKYKEAIGDLL